jgi:hypothetical protein
MINLSEIQFFEHNYKKYINKKKKSMKIKN